MSSSSSEDEYLDERFVSGSPESKSPPTTTLPPPAVNRGLKIMQKMGYSVGESLGADGKSGITEPIQVTMKQNKRGLSHLTTPSDHPNASKSKAKSAAAKKAKTERREMDFSQLKQTFRENKSKSLDYKSLASDIRKSRFSCQDLDESNGKPSSAFWPLSDSLENLGGDDSYESRAEFESLEPPLQLMALTAYLRSEYNYCIWCGCRFRSQQELLDECPGDSRQIHDD